MFDRKNNARLFPFRSSRAGKWSGSLSISCSVLHQRLGGWVGLADGAVWRTSRSSERVGRADGSVERTVQSARHIIERTGLSDGRVGRTRFDERTDDLMVVCGDSKSCQAGRSGERAHGTCERTGRMGCRTARAGGWPVGHDSNLVYCDITFLAS